MSDKIEKIRQKLYQQIEKYGIQSQQVKKISERIDRITNNCLKEKPTIQVNTMQDNYQVSYYNLKIWMVQNGRFPTVTEWNQFAKKHGYMNSESLKYSSGLNWTRLRDKLEKEI